MRLLIAASVLVVLPATASANGFGLFRRPAPAQSCPSYYYAPVESPYYYSVVPAPAYPVPIVPAPAVPVPMPLPLRGQPAPVMPLAPPEVAPPSTAPVLRPTAIPPMSYADERTTSAKAKTPFFDVYTSADAQPGPAPGRFLIRFWNLSTVPLMLEVDGPPRGAADGSESDRGDGRGVCVAGRGPCLGGRPGAGGCSGSYCCHSALGQRRWGLAPQLAKGNLQMEGRLTQTGEGAMKLSEVVREYIPLGEASRIYWERELPKYHPRYPIIRDGEESPPAPPEDAQIEALLRRLSEEQLYTLLVLADVGVSNYHANDLQSVYRRMKEFYPSSDEAIAHMVESFWLADDLAEGIEEFQKRNIDLDDFKFATTETVS